MKSNERVYNLQFGEILPLYYAKVERKNRPKEGVLTLLNWLTGYNVEEIESMADSETTLREFFDKAPALNPLRHNLSGSICGVKIQEIEEPLMKEIRYMDKIVDQLFQGKALKKNMNPK